MKPSLTKQEYETLSDLIRQAIVNRQDLDIKELTNIQIKLKKLMRKQGGTKQNVRTTKTIGKTFPKDTISKWRTSY